MQSAVQTKNNKASGGICFSREDKAVTWLGPAAYWRYVRRPRRDTNAVCHRSCTLGAEGQPGNRFCNCFGRTNSKESSGICFSREDKAVTWLGPAAYWKYVRSPRRGTNAVFHRSCTFGAVRPPENKFRSGYWADVVSTTDYYPFGMGMVERGDDGGYRYGFNGKEKDGEGMGGGGSTYDYGFRIYNPGLGKFLSVDPLMGSYPWNGPFNYAENDIIRSIDFDGLEKYIVVLTFGGNVTRPKFQVLEWGTLFPGEKQGPMGNGTAYYSEIEIPDFKSGSVIFAEKRKSFEFLKYESGNNNDISYLNNQILYSLIELSSKTSFSFNEVANELLTSTSPDLIKAAMRWTDGKFDKQAGKYIGGVLKYAFLLQDLVDIKNMYETTDFSNSEELATFFETLTEKATLAGAGAISPFVCILIEDAKSSDGLTNLDNGRLANSYKSSYNTRENYIRQNFHHGEKSKGSEIESSKGETIKKLESKNIE